MENRNEKIVLMATKGATFDCSQNKSGSIVIKAIPNTNVHFKDEETCRIDGKMYSLAHNNVYSKNYKKPPIIDGYTHVEGKWNNRFVIKRISDGSELVWIPVGCLVANGTIDGKHFTEKFGRRNFLDENNEFSEKQFHEDMTPEFAFSLESVKKYGGFYLSRYTISEGPDGKPQSVKNEYPLTNLTQDNAIKKGYMFESSTTAISHLLFGAEYDSVVEWLIKFAGKNPNDFTWGNHISNENSLREVVKTGSKEKWCVFNIYDFFGNVLQFTQERYGDSDIIVRGSDCGYWCRTVCYRTMARSDREIENTGMRVAVYPR